MNLKSPNCFWRHIGLVLLVLSVVLSGCNSRNGPEKSTTPDKSFRVVAASYPLQYFAQRIATDKIRVEFLVDSDTDPREWSPSVKQIQDVQTADLVIVNGPGAAYAKWLVRVSLLDSKICRTANGFSTDDYFMIKDYQIVHTHGPEGKHSHAYMVPYTWLDPMIAKTQAESIASALCETYPELASEFLANLDGLQKDLDQLAADFKESSSGGLVVTSSPDAKFLTRALGLDDRHLFLFDFELPSLADA